MLLQGNNHGSSWCVSVRRASPDSFAERRDAVYGRCHANPKGAAVVSRHCVTALAKGATLHWLRLVAKYHSSAGPIIITLKEH